MIPAIIETNGIAYFALFQLDGGFHLIAPITDKPPQPAEPGYVLWAMGPVVEATLRASGQWMPLLTLMGEQMDDAILSRLPETSHRRRYKRLMNEYPFLADLPTRYLANIPLPGKQPANVVAFPVSDRSKD